MPQNNPKQEPTLAERRDATRKAIAERGVYGVSFNHKIRPKLFKIISENDGVELFDLVSKLVQDVIEEERVSLIEQFRTDLSKIEFYVNNAGWDTEERRYIEISTIWGIRDKYTKELPDD